MLPESHQQFYQSLRHAIAQLHAAIARPDRDPSTVKPAIVALQHDFNQQILSATLEAAELEPATDGKIQSYEVEIDKQLRLLGMDAMFLQAARQSATANQRWDQMGDRLNLLLRYCDALLQSS